MEMPTFNLDNALKAANQAVYSKTGRNLSDVETIVFRGCWEKLTYDQIAARHQYAAAYLSQDVAPKLWKSLSGALGEDVKKANFREPLKRYWERWKSRVNSTLPPLVPDDGEPEPPQPSLPKNYVERSQIEARCYEALLQPGALVRLKAPSLTGKTTLMNRVLARIYQEQNYRTVNISFRLAEQIHLSNLNKFLHWFCLTVARELRLPSQLEHYWDEENIGAKVSCTSYFEDYILAGSARPLVLCLDDVDLLFPHPEVYEDFFGLLRLWFEKGKTRDRWKKMRLAIIHATDMYIRLNIHQSPFNVGLPVELKEFSEAQVREFALASELDLSAEQFDVGLEKLMEMVGGHPYLLERAFSYLKNYPSVRLSELIDKMPTEEGIYGNHLRQHLQSLKDHEELAIAFKKVALAHHSVRLEPMTAHCLQSMGLVNISGNEVTPRCHLYRLYFCQHLGDL